MYNPTTRRIDPCDVVDTDGLASKLLGYWSNVVQEVDRHPTGTCFYLSTSGRVERVPRGRESSFIQQFFESIWLNLNEIGRFGSFR